MDVRLPPLPSLQVHLVERGGFKSFIKVCWPQIDPAPLIHSWHIDEIADHLEAVYRGQIKNLLINLPPASGKSSIVNVLWPLWCWIQDPSVKWIFGSNDPGLAHRDARRVRELIVSKWWRARWPHVRLNPRGSEAVGDFETDRMGARLSVGVGTRILGRHADIKVVDDPNKPQGLDGPVEVSRADLNKVIEWWTGVLSGRNVDVNTTRTVVIMQRLHEMDLTGYLLDQMRQGGEHFEHLCLPMEFEVAHRSITSIGGDRRTVEGELLAPARTNAEAVATLKKKYVSPRKIESQLQQRPSPRGGGIIKAHWLRHWGPCSPRCEERNCPGPLWDKLPVSVESMRQQQSWDLTFDGQEHNDYVCGQVWGEHGDYSILLHQTRAQLTFLKSLTEFENTCQDWPRAYIKKVENKANAMALENVLKSRIAGITLVNPEGSKAARLEACEELYESGRVVYPSPLLNPWVETVNFHELLSFPSGKNDDTVDATTQELKRHTKLSMAKRYEAANKGGRAWLAGVSG